MPTANATTANLMIACAAVTFHIRIISCTNKLHDLETIDPVGHVVIDVSESGSADLRGLVSPSELRREHMI